MSSFHQLQWDSTRPLVLGGFLHLARIQRWPIRNTRMIGGAGLFMISLCVSGSIWQLPWIAAGLYLALAVIARIWRNRSDVDLHRSGSNGHLQKSLEDLASPTSIHLADLEQRLIRLNRRMERLEALVTSPAFHWDRRFDPNG